MEGLTVTIILLVLTWISYKLFTRRNAKGKPFPGPRGYPLVGSAFELNMDNIYAKFYEFARKYGDVFQIQTFGTTNVVLNSSELIHKAFCGDEYKSFLNNKPIFFYGDYFYQGGQTIAFCRDPNERVHGEMRKGLARSLHVYGDGIPRFEMNVNGELKRLVDEIARLEGKEFDVVTVLRVSLCNLMSILLTGEAAEKEDIESFWDIVWKQDFFLGAVTNTVLTTFPFLIRIPGFYKTQSDGAMAAKGRIVEKYFLRMKATRRPGVTRGIVDWYLEHQQQELDEGREPFMTDARIVNHILEIIIAGIVTTMSTLSSVILCLVNHVDCQDKLHEELDNVSDHLSLAARRKCPFTEAVLMESQRYLTTAPFLGPHVCSEDINFEGFDMKKDTIVYPNAWYVHHDETIWGDPWVFRPERFLDASGDLLPNTHVYRKSWIPFGMGRRQCPGEGLARSRLYLYVAALFKTFKFIPVDGRCGTSDPRTGQFDKNITFRPKPYYCRAVKRDERKQTDA